MIEFLGMPLLGKLSPDVERANLGALCGVSDERSKELVKALMLAKKNAFVDQQHVLMPGMEPVMGQHFNLVLLLERACVDLNTLPEIMLVGLLIGRIYTELEARAAENNQKIGKMVALFQTNPAKALRKMEKDMKKLAGKK